MTAASTFDEVGATLDKVLREHAESIADHHARFHDHQTQLGAMNISLNAVRAEVLGRIDVCEVKVLQAIADIHDELRKLVRAGANGHA